MGSTEPARSSSIHVDLDDRQQAHHVESASLAKLLAATITAQHGAMGVELQQAEVGLAFVEASEMTELNVEHMGGDGPTDVLAFPIDGIDASHIPDDQPALLGDIVVCPAVADQAPQQLTDELALLVVHGALHLLGHDHAEPEETAIMKRLENEMLERFHPA